MLEVMRPVRQEAASGQGRHHGSRAEGSAQGMAGSGRPAGRLFWPGVLLLRTVRNDSAECLSTFGAVVCPWV